MVEELPFWPTACTPYVAVEDCGSNTVNLSMYCCPFAPTVASRAPSLKTLKPVSLLDASVHVKVVVCWKLGKRSPGLVSVTQVREISRLVGGAGSNRSGPMGTSGTSTVPEFELSSDESEFESFVLPESFELVSDDCTTTGAGGGTISGSMLVFPTTVEY